MNQDHWEYRLTATNVANMRDCFREGNTVEDLMEIYKAPRPVVEMVVYTINTVD